MIMKEMPEWGPLATFVPNKDRPVYNWFYYKEGFSRDLVINLIKKFQIAKKETVLDPFCGAGTTQLACGEHGINSTGFDVHPAAVFASVVKTRDYDVAMLKDAAGTLFEKRFEMPEAEIRSAFVRRCFNSHTLDDVIFFRDTINRIKDNETRDFLLLALMNVTMKCSYAWKDGAVIKIRKHPVPPLRKFLKRQVYRMIMDLEKFPRTNAVCETGFGDARKIRLQDNSVDAVITSPPYLNKIEYTKIYSIEEELFFDMQRIPVLRSFIGTESEKVLDKKDSVESLVEARDLPIPAIAYFSDMHQVVRELHRVCRPGAKLGIVIGNGCFPTGVVDSDTLLTRIAEKSGFMAREILVLNKRWCTRNRVEKVGVTRESLLVWERN